ncbi:MAG: alpha-2-macroglobulin [Prevotella sp.]|nr:alpha-2-macroglobulin [Prevotella sp.]
MKVVLTLLLALLSMTIQGQAYTALWKQADEAEKKDLPRTQYDVLMKIVAKAQKEGQYGQLMAAELAGSRVMATIAPDSLQPAVERMEQRRRQTADKVLATVYTVVLKKIYNDNSQLEKGDDLTVTLDAETCQQLAAVKATAYKPLTVNGRDSRWFDDDMLSVVGYELKDYHALNDYYNKAGNRVAALMTALAAVRQQRPAGYDVKLSRATYVQTLDSLIALYGDLPECGEVAIERYSYMQDHTDATPETLWQTLEEALQRWGGYERTNELRNAQKNLTQRTFEANVFARMGLPGVEQKMGTHGQPLNLKNISQLTMRIYKAKVGGDTQLNPQNDKDYKKLKPLLTEMPELRVTRQYSGHQAYEWFTDSLTLPGLPVGVYMIEMESVPSTEVSRQFYFVSNLRTMVEALPGKQIRYVVVDALEGQPVKGATIELRGYVNGRSDQKMATLTTDDKGEATYQYDKNRPTVVYAYTSDDKACMPMNSYNNFSYYDNERRVEQTQLFTDRAIYRPGQTVHVAAIAYEVKNGFEQKALEGKQLTLTLRDANYKTVAEKTLKTDRYGSCATDFTLPANGLTGHFSIQTSNGGCGFRVEEYKRPTFEVEFDKVTEDYQDGDTVVVKATARSYAGVPVQGAKVHYTVERRPCYWWWVDADEEQVAEGEAITGDDGTFTVSMPMVLPKTDRPMFYNFVCTADVTDQAGETHQGVTALPLGNRKTAFSIDLPEEVRIDRGGKMTFQLRNAAGNDIPETAKYHFDNGKWLTAKTNTPIELPKLASGRYTLEAICAGDTVKQQFTVFSLDDKRPAAETDCWFYQSDYQFPNDGSPVTVQIGSSAKNVHIVYSIISGNRVIESGAVDRSNELINRKWSYKEEYGNGLLLTYAWVKQGKHYSRVAHIQRPLPDKRLKLEWQTFRDRLTPGQQEEWTLTVKAPSPSGNAEDGASPADALLMATLYDKSLDQIARHNWSFSPYQYISLPSTQWQYGTWGGLYLHGELYQKPLSVNPITLTRFDESLFPQMWRLNRLEMGSVGGVRMMAKASVQEAAIGAFDVKGNDAGEGELLEKAVVSDEAVVEEAAPDVQLRENLQETAFFYPRLQTDSTGSVSLKFTLPESLTTWRFMGLAHTPDLCYGLLEGEAVAKKDLMVQPNVPRFIREGDQATITARIINTSEKDLNGTAFLTLTEPETEKVVLSQNAVFSVKAGETTSVTFPVSPTTAYPALLVAKVVASTDEFSDGEQHYLPILPNRERVTVTLPFTQNEPGTKEIDLTKLVPATVTDAKLTFEYTNNPAWLMIQALPAVGHPNDDCAICQAASLYANSIGKHIIDQVPQAKTVFEQWKREEIAAGEGTAVANASLFTLHSSLQKNQELKDLILNETPWVADADRETEQRQQLADFFDENLMQQRLQSALDKLNKLQRSDGSWSWWPEMPGSTYMTLSVAEMMVRQNAMTGEQQETKQMLSKAIKYLGKEMVELVAEMKKQEKKGYKQMFPGNSALEWLYICKLDGRQLPTDVQQANGYLVKLLKKETKNQTIYQKALSAIILDSPTYIKSLKEYTVYQEEMGRYYDTPRAGYSWRDYRIPTQVAAIEAIQRLTPDDQQTLDEMRRWLLQQKRTQAWDTPINSVDAVYAFLSEKLRVKSEEFPTGVLVGEGVAAANSSLFTLHSSLLSLDGKPLDTPKATAGIGYVKTAQPYNGEKTFTATKQSEDTSWGAV